MFLFAKLTKEIIFVCTIFLFIYAVNGLLYLPLTTYNVAIKSACITQLNSGCQILIFTHLPCLKRTVAKINLDT